MAKGNDGERWHFVYRTTNKINGKYYIGVHSTWKLDDGYLGSGKRLSYSIKKYGRENFELEIIQFFETHKEALEKERELVNEQLLRDSMCMNLRLGGEGGGGWSIEQQRNLGVRARAKWTEMLKDPEVRKKLALKTSQDWKDGKHASSKIGTLWNGRKHSSSTIERMSQTHKGMAAGEKNGRFGSVWIFNETEQRTIAIRKEDLEVYLSIGWKRGRKFKWKVNPNGDGA